MANSARTASEQEKWAKEARANILTQDQANEQSGKTLNPIYDKIVDKNLSNLDKSNMARGFYGQLPGDVLKRSTEGDLRNQQSAAIANLSNQLVGQSRDYASSLAQQAMQAKQQEYNNIGNFVNTVGNAAGQYYDQTGYRFGLGGLLNGLGGQADYPAANNRSFVSDPGQQTWAGNGPGSSPTLTAPTTKAYGVDLSSLGQNSSLDIPSTGWSPSTKTPLETQLEQWKVNPYVS
jgi:hypothetical protein